MRATWCVLLGRESGGTPSQLGTNDYDRVSWLEALDTGKILCVCVGRGWGGGSGEEGDAQGVEAEAGAFCFGSADPSG